ncbi:MAG TPA: NAD(P)/FAD-dependent oxidoreductase [Thermoanaerobaculia bacterium]|nr:NAD(P)/FAD-dependent oxidoreductase [Thermoanaerobaculia bacterium]
MSQSTEKSCDVVVIGGGPAGSAAATVLARRGARVIICERERFPRFHVGESLLPYQASVLARLGLTEKIADGCFVPKYGAYFMANDGSACSEVDFGRLLKPPFTYAYQVERSKFDHILLRHAAASGAEVLEEHAVVETELACEKCRVTVRASDGSDLILNARWVLDASGQGSFLARRLNLRENAQDLKKVAHFAHFRGGQRRTGREEGHITLVFGAGCWFWHIPLSDNRASVGCVVDHHQWKGSGQKADEFLASMIAASPWLAGWLEGSEQITDVHTVANFSYTAQRFVGPGWALVGDAATFLDPVFSTGVLLALRSGELAGSLLADRISRARPLTEATLAPYEKKMRRWSTGYFELIRAFYKPQFARIFFNPVDFFQRPITHFLGGRLELGLRHRLIIRLFHLLVRFNPYLHIVPEPRSAEASIPHG